MGNSKKAFRDYLQLEKKYSIHTVNGYLNDVEFFETYIATNFEQENILEVNYSQIRSWIVLLVDSGVSNTTVNRKIASLKSYYKFLVKTKQIQTSPLLKHKALKTQQKLQIPFSENELNHVLFQIQYPEGFEGYRDKLIIDLFYTTGIRRSELINLKLSGVDYSNATLKVVGKRNKERILPVLPSVLSEIKNYLVEKSKMYLNNESEYLFLTKRGNKLNDTFVYRLINNYFSNVSEKVKKSPHILRHTFATHLLNNGADINSVKELLGHSSLASTQVYTHSSLFELKKVYNGAHPRSLK